MHRATVIDFNFVAVVTQIPARVIGDDNCTIQELVEKKNSDPIIFGLANPVPEIMPDVARAAGAAIVATGRSDFPNQINNVLAYPGVFRGALDGRLRQLYFYSYFLFIREITVR